MSYYKNAPSSGGLTSVATDATLTGDGTSGDPLSVVPSGSGVYSVAKTVFTGIAFTYTVPVAAIYLDTATAFAQTITSTDVDFATGDIRFNSTGTYKISMQMTCTKLAAPSQEDLQIVLGWNDGPPSPTPIYGESSSFAHFDSNGTGNVSTILTTVLEIGSVGDTIQPILQLDGTVGVQVDLFVGVEAGWIIVERLA